MCAKEQNEKVQKTHIEFRTACRENKREIMRNEEQMEQIYIKIDEKHAGFDKDEG